MKRWLPVAMLLTGLALITTAPTVSAQEGIKLSWDNCQALGPGVLDKTYACDLNTGSATFVASYTAPDSVALWTSTETTIDLIVNSGAFPDWWRLRNQVGQTGQCRNGALSASQDFTGAPYAGVCSDTYLNQGAGGITSYTVGRDGPLTARLTVTYSVPSANQIPLNPGEEYFAVRATILYTKTIGSGSCAGCSLPVCIVLNGVRAIQPAGSPGGNVMITNPIPPATRTITWQGGTGADCNMVPTKNHTWGQIKALYR